MPELIENIKKKANEQRITIHQVEMNAGIANGSISSWRKGSIPRIDTLQKVANTLGCTIDELMNG